MAMAARGMRMRVICMIAAQRTLLLPCGLGLLGWPRLRGLG